MNDEAGYNSDHKLEPITTFDFDALDRSEDIETRKDVQMLVCEKLCQFAGELAAHDRPALTLDSFLLAFGLTDVSETALARKHHVTKQALSKRAVEITRALGVHPSRSMKSEQARKTYAERTKQYHNSNRTEKEKRRRHVLKRIIGAIKAAGPTTGAR